MKTLVLAAMPLVLMANTASLPNIDLWIAAEPMLRSALECSSELDITDERLKGFPQYADGSWEIRPARDFSIMGLPISTITLFIDATGKLGSSYTAVIEKRSLQQVEQAISFLQQQGPRAGRMSTAELGLRGPIVLTCTVSTE
ncbi:hypothetical protein ACOI9X_26070 [Pseudomonas sp. P2757]|uniref:hypothetical protein n=1 Tax=unclassified Pseudomonas TaxID=196821 RepID=UPI003B5BA4AF